MQHVETCRDNTLRFFAAASAMLSMLPETTAAACILMMSVDARETLSRHVESVLRHVSTRYDCCDMSRLLLHVSTDATDAACRDNEKPDITSFFAMVRSVRVVSISSSSSARC